MIELANETDVQIWCDFQEETKQNSADYFLRLRFYNFRTFVADVNHYVGGNDCITIEGWGAGDDWGFGDGDCGDGFGDGDLCYGVDAGGYGHGYGNTHGDGCCSDS